MAKVKLHPGAAEDIERLVTFLRDTDPAGAAATAQVIFDGLRVLGAHPLIGRPIDHARRELVIFRGRTGYVAQYAYRMEEDEVVIAAVRHQREVEE